MATPSTRVTVRVPGEPDVSWTTDSEGTHTPEPRQEEPAEQGRASTWTEPRYCLLWWRSAVRESYGVVASVNAGQWAAYMGLCPTQYDANVLATAKYGAKLSEEEARAFVRGRFGLDDLPYRR